MAPDGSWVGGDNVTMAPDGSWVGYDSSDSESTAVGLNAISLRYAKIKN